MLRPVFIVVFFIKDAMVVDSIPQTSHQRFYWPQYIAATKGLVAVSAHQANLAQSLSLVHIFASRGAHDHQYAYATSIHPSQVQSPLKMQFSEHGNFLAVVRGHGISLFRVGNDDHGEDHHHKTFVKVKQCQKIHRARVYNQGLTATRDGCWLITRFTSIGCIKTVNNAGKVLSSFGNHTEEFFDASALAVLHDDDHQLIVVLAHTHKICSATRTRKQCVNVFTKPSTIAKLRHPMRLMWMCAVARMQAMRFCK